MRNQGASLPPQVDEFNVRHSFFGQQRRQFIAHIAIVQPPSIGNVPTVTSEAASEHSQTTTSATSCGVPARPEAWTRPARSETFPIAVCVIGVSMIPGAIALTRILSTAPPSAALLVRPEIPCLAA